VSDDGVAGPGARAGVTGLESLAGRRLGPASFALEAGRVADYVAATRDDPGRWVDAAPPGIAGVALFAVAPLLLDQPELSGLAVVHGDQTFDWHGPAAIGSAWDVTGTVTRVRERGGVAFVGFDLEAVDAAGPAVTGSSTFVVGPRPAPAPEEPEPDYAAAGVNDDPGSADDPVRRSASRLDLVRYAGVSHDWNPIHWDHATEVGAGLPGVIVHGLLVAAWAWSVAAAGVPGPAPLASSRVRFRAPLRPGTQASVTTQKTPGGAAIEVAAGDVTVASVTVSYRE